MITPESMREKLVEAMARAIWLSADPEEGAMEWWKEQARAALEAIEAQGLAIVPVKMTQAQFDACAKVAWASPDIYDAMIQAGRITEPATPAVNIPETFY